MHVLHFSLSRIFNRMTSKCLSDAHLHLATKPEFRNCVYRAVDPDAVDTKISLSAGSSCRLPCSLELRRSLLGKRSDALLQVFSLGNEDRAKGFDGRSIVFTA